MHKKFDSTEIEKRWQAHWEQSGIYDNATRDESKEKEYVLVEWPYPSGNLHIGHWHAFAVPDIYVRAKRMQGKQVLFPMGFDAFGLPAENAAIKNNLDPKEWTEKNSVYMKEQLKSMGNAFSWNMTTSSIDPEYYKWTQWMFTQFFEKNIAYRGIGTVNWCPSCNTVLANEQVVNDHCGRCDNAIEKKEMEEWKLRITKFADQLIDDLDALDWPEHIKEAQRQWIGKSAGAELDFVTTAGDTLSIFTTRPDTLFGATYMVLAPEHTALEKYKDVIENWDEVVRYIALSKEKSEIERTNAEKEKTGVELKGVKAINPATGAEIPIFVADYVLAGYGTGAIMAVPAHDERDFTFAKKYDLPITQVVSGDDNIPYTGTGELTNSGSLNGLDSEEAKKVITAKVGGKLTNTYRLRDWSIGRQRYWGTPIPIVYDPERKAHAIPEKHLPWLLPTDVDFRPTGEPPLAKSKELKERTVKIFGEGWTPEVETMDTFVDSSWYFLRYIDNHNDDVFSSKGAQLSWMPVDTYFGGAEHTTMHLLYSRFWQKALHALGLVEHNEPYRRRVNRGLVLGPDGNKMSKSKGNVIDPDEQVKRLGADTVKMYLAFMGPYGETGNYPWDMGGIAGLRRFLERVNGLLDHVQDTEAETTTRLLHKTIKKVTEDIEVYKFNTAISALMIFVNHTEKEGLSRETCKTFLKLLAPFAPHLTEELWQSLGETTSIHLAALPTADSTLTVDDEVTIGVQINGKMRGNVTLSPEASEDEALQLVEADAGLAKHLVGDQQKIIYKKGKIINIIMKNNGNP